MIFACVRPRVAVTLVDVAYWTVRFKVVVCVSAEGPLARIWIVYVPVGVGDPEPDPEFGGVEPAQLLSEIAALHSKSSKADVRTVILSLRRRLVNKSESRLGSPRVAAHVIGREIPKGEDGSARLAVPPV